jgi:hypothetical protein
MSVSDDLELGVCADWPATRRLVAAGCSMAKRWWWEEEGGRREEEKLTWRLSESWRTTNQLGLNTQARAVNPTTTELFLSPFFVITDRTLQMSELTLDTLVDDGQYALGGGERARQEAQALLDELERRRKARNMAVPTDDGRVRARLREIGEPITLFGERVRARRVIVSVNSDI